MSFPSDEFHVHEVLYAFNAGSPGNIGFQAIIPIQDTPEWEQVVQALDAGMEKVLASLAVSQPTWNPTYERQLRGYRSS